MPLSEPVRLALIGCGGMGFRHAAACQAMNRQGAAFVDLVALCDLAEGRRDELGRLLEAGSRRRPKLYAEAGDAFEDPEVEAVLVALPTFLHHQTVIDALSAGKHVLVEKPLAITVKACDLIVAAAERSGKVVAVAENYRRIPGNRALKRLFETGAIGAPQLMLMRNITRPTGMILLGDRRTEASTWYRDRLQAGAYQLLELGVHEADLQRYWFGEVESVSGEVANFRDPATWLRGEGRPAEDTALATLRFKNGLLSQMALSSAGGGPATAQRTLIAEKGSATSRVWHNWEGGTVHFPDGREVAAGAATSRYLEDLQSEERERLLPAGSFQLAEHSDPNAPLTYGVGTAIADFARAVRGGWAPEISPCDARTAVAICYAILEAATAQRSINVAEVLAGEADGAQAEINDALRL